MIGRVARGVLVIGLWVGLAEAAWAGGSGLDEDDSGNAGTPFFGFVKDQTNGGTLPDAKVTAEIKGGNASLITRADAQGHYRISGFGNDVDPDKVDVTCSADGYKQLRSVRRKLSSDPGAPVEVDCLMVKQ